LTEGIVILLAFSGFGAIFVGLKHWFRQRDVKVQQLIQINVAAA
ncbi:MAG TPA: Fis family transcriptional regulator, partial [Idiomarina sp.]|nr:Fis family transcriptional regulator [Idiomarina sp.]